MEDGYLNSPQENPNHEEFVGLLSDLMRNLGYDKGWVQRYLNNPKKLEEYANENPTLHSGQLLWAYLDICGFHNPNGTKEDGIAFLWEIVMLAGAIGIFVGIGAISIPAIPGLSLGFTKAIVLITSMCAAGYGGYRSVLNTGFKNLSTGRVMDVCGAARQVIEGGEGH